MKKYIVLLLVMMMSVGMMTACGGASALAKEDLKIGVVHILDPADQGYTYNHDLGAKYMIKALGLNESQYIPKFNIDDQDVAATNNALQELVEAGCQIIFATSFSYGSQVTEFAKTHPDVQFCHATGLDAHFNDLPNLHNYFAKIHQARYLGGIAAGLKAKEIGNPKLGYVAAFPFAEVISGYTAFYLGAKSVYPDVTMDVIFINSWGNAIVEAEVAKTLIDRGCGVISQHSDNVAPATVAEANGAFHVGYNNDMVAAAPKASLLSARINWGIYMTYAVQCMIDGTDIVLDWSEGLVGGAADTGAAYLSPLNAAIAAPGTQDAINTAISEILGGKKVFAGALVDNAGSPSVITSFTGDVVYVFENADASYAESDVTTGTSAPSFNASVAGINIIE
jgi:basic membrane protein A